MRPMWHGGAPRRRRRVELMSDADFAGLRRLIAQLLAEGRELREAVEKLSSQVKHASFDSLRKIRWTHDRPMM
jgi:hypothetical protein